LETGRSAKNVLTQKIDRGLPFGLMIAVVDTNTSATTPMDRLIRADETVEVFGEPLAVAMTGPSVDSVGIDLRGEHGEDAETASGPKASLFENGA
jgi:hypothetical protein